MNVAEIKNDLHRVIVETDDLEILEQMMAYIAVLRDEKKIWDTLSDAEKESIQRGLADMDAGRTKTNEEVRAKVSSIFN
ncbi:MAG: hypothetical protein KF852_20060 [Saprospiraceae bacterium]|jgi:predicted transcriptional regulator|nr:hypothetical protein [Saprospiraceae bacterium]